MSLTPILLAATLAAASPADEEAAMLAPVEALFDALAAKDGEAFKSVFGESAHVRSYAADREERPMRYSHPEKSADNLGSDTDDLYEEMRDPKVMIDGDIASVWAPYTFRLNGAFHHCGVDVITLLKLDGEWKIVDLTYTMTKDCAEDGFPATD